MILIGLFKEAQQKALDAMNAVLASGKDANSSRPVKIAEQGMAACLADLKVMTLFSDIMNTLAFSVFSLCSKIFSIRRKMIF